MIARNCDGRVPEPGEFTAEDEALFGAAAGLLEERRGMPWPIWRSTGCSRRSGRVVGDANRYVDAQAPWALRKTDPARMNTVLYVLADTIRQLAIFVQPVVPDAAAALLAQLSVPEGGGCPRLYPPFPRGSRPVRRCRRRGPFFPRFVTEDAA